MFKCKRLIIPVFLAIIAIAGIANLFFVSSNLNVTYGSTNNYITEKISQDTLIVKPSGLNSSDYITIPEKYIDTQIIAFRIEYSLKEWGLLASGEAFLTQADPSVVVYNGDTMGVKFELYEGEIYFYALNNTGMFINNTTNLYCEIINVFVDFFIGGEDDVNPPVMLQDIEISFERSSETEKAFTYMFLQYTKKQELSFTEQGYNFCLANIKRISGTEIVFGFNNQIMSPPVTDEWQNLNVNISINSATYTNIKIRAVSDNWKPLTQSQTITEYDGSGTTIPTTDKYFPIWEISIFGGVVIAFIVFSIRRS